VTRLQRAITRLKARGQHRPQSPLGKTLDYALGVWSTLTVFLNDGLTRLPQMTNHQISDVTPEAWGKAQRQRHWQPAA